MDKIFKYIIVSYLIVDPITGDFMIVSQFANGGNLQDFLQQKLMHEGVFVINWTDVIQISIQIILGLQYLHSKEIIHSALLNNNFKL